MVFQGKMFGYTEGIGPSQQTRKLASKAVILMVSQSNVYFLLQRRADLNETGNSLANHFLLRY